MAIPKDEFWSSDAVAHHLLTDEMVAEAERQLGVKLPKEYIAMLQLQNGGYTRRFGFPMSQRTAWADDHVPFFDMAGIYIDINPSTHLSVLDTENMTKEWGLPPRQVLLSGDGHWWITLDYRTSDKPSVAWIDVEVGEDIQVAPSFAAFLGGLKPISEFSFD